MTETKRRVRRPAGQDESEASARAVVSAADKGRQTKPPRPHLARQYARKRFAQRLPEIFDTYAEAAVGGDVASLKALIALVGFDREDAHERPRRARRGKSLVQLLMEDLQKNPPAVVQREPGDWVDE